MVRSVLISCLLAAAGCNTLEAKYKPQNKPAGDLSHLALMKTPEEFKDRVAADLKVDLRAVGIQLVNMPEGSGVVGLACRADLILLDARYWVKISPVKKYALVAHEVGHIFGVPHSMEEVTAEKRGLKVQLFKSLMVPSINYLSDYTLISFFDFYIEQQRRDINAATMESFMKVMGHTVGKQPTIQDCLKQLEE